MRSGLLLGLVVLVADAGAQEFFRCTGPDGKVTYQQTSCAATSVEQKIDATPANTDYDPSQRERILREGAEAGRKLEARAAKEEEERRKREEQRALDEKRESEARAREEAREQPYYYAWPAGSRPIGGGGLPARPGARPQPQTPGK